METYVQIAALCVVSAVLVVVLRHRSPEYAYALGLLCCGAVFLAARAFWEPVLTFFDQLREIAGINAALMAPVFKTLGIGILSQIAGAFCQDAGEQALARVVELCGTTLALYTALPLANQLIGMLGTMMGG